MEDNGHSMFNDEYKEQCAEAIYSAGIRPEDVAAFVEAVQAHEEYKHRAEVHIGDRKAKSKYMDAMNKAAALLPEAKKS